MSFIKNIIKGAVKVQRVPHEAYQGGQGPQIVMETSRRGLPHVRRIVQQRRRRDGLRERVVRSEPECWNRKGNCS